MVAVVPQPHGNHARRSLQAHQRAVTEGKGRPQHRMSRERQLHKWGEDPDAGVGLRSIRRRQHEDRLREVQLASGSLHQFRFEPRSVKEHGHRIAVQRLLREHVHHDVSMHGALSPPGPCRAASSPSASCELWAQLAGTGLGVTATARNWTTVTTLLDMAQEG